MKLKKQRAPFLLRILAKTVKQKQNPTFTGEAKAGQWYWTEMPGYKASDGSGYGFDFKLGRADSLIIFFHGGGVSLDSHTADHPTDLNAADLNDCYYSPKAGSYGGDGHRFGLLGEMESNPFRDWSMLSLPYCTADFHVGSGEFDFRSEDGSMKTLCHHGYINSMASIRRMKEIMHAGPARILIAGNSAGGFGAVLMADAIIREFPKCKEFCCLDDSGLLPDVGWARIAADVWKSPAEIVSKIGNNPFPLDTLLSLHRAYGEKLKILFACSTRDVCLTQMEGYQLYQRLYADRKLGDQFEQCLKDFVSTLTRAIPSCGLYLHDTSAGGRYRKADLTKHCLIIDPQASSKLTDNTSILEWLHDAVNGDIAKKGLQYLQ